MLSLDSETRQRGKTCAVGRVGKRRQHGTRLIGLGLREPRSVLNCAHPFNAATGIGCQ